MRDDRRLEFPRHGLSVTMLADGRTTVVGTGPPDQILWPRAVDLAIRLDRQEPGLLRAVLQRNSWEELDGLLEHQTAVAERQVDLEALHPPAGIQFQCPSCSQIIGVEMSMAGDSGGCPGCRSQIAIPDPRAARKFAYLVCIEQTRASAEADPGGFQRMILANFFADLLSYWNRCDNTTHVDFIKVGPHAKLDDSFVVNSSLAFWRRKYGHVGQTSLMSIQSFGSGDGAVVIEYAQVDKQRDLLLAQSRRDPPRHQSPQVRDAPVRDRVEFMDKMSGGMALGLVVGFPLLAAVVVNSGEATESAWKMTFTVGAVLLAVGMAGWGLLGYYRPRKWSITIEKGVLIADDEFALADIERIWLFEKYFDDQLTERTLRCRLTSSAEVVTLARFGTTHDDSALDVQTAIAFITTHAPHVIVGEGD